MDNCADVREVTELVLSDSICPARWVLCVSEDSPVQEVADLEGKRIATEAVGLTTVYLKKHGVEARVEFSWGATEVKPAIESGHTPLWTLCMWLLRSGG